MLNFLIGQLKEYTKQLIIVEKEIIKKHKLQLDFKKELHKANGLKALQKECIRMMKVIYDKNEEMKKEPYKFENWVIYDNPSDYPNKFVVRQFFDAIPTKNIFLADSLEEIRGKIPQSFVNIGRFEEDEPQLVEVWA